MDLKITDEARKRIQLDIQNSDLVAPVFAIIWGGWSHRAGEWVVGYYEREDADSADCIQIAGLEMMIEMRDRPVLSGAALDFRDGRFLVSGARVGGTVNGGEEHT